MILAWLLIIYRRAKPLKLPDRVASEQLAS